MVTCRSATRDEPSAIESGRPDAQLSKARATVTWNPRDELPGDQVKVDGFPTPVLEAVKFAADGRYVFVRRIPGYDSEVMLHDKPVRVPDEWHEWKGDWDISKGELDMEDADTEWRAERRKKGWVLPDKKSWPVEPGGATWGRWFKIVELTHSRLQLKAVALGDFDRAFHRANAMPERPAPGSEPL